VDLIVVSVRNRAAARPQYRVRRDQDRQQLGFVRVGLGNRE